jgi:hypothetical protein
LPFVFIHHPKIVLILSAEYLLQILLSCSFSIDMVAQPAPLLITFRFEAWCQSLTKGSIVDPIYDRSFLFTPDSAVNNRRWII